MSNYHLAITRIFDQYGIVVGAGFLVSGNQILTCAHVIASALGIKKSDRSEQNQESLADQSVQLDFQNDEKIEASVVFYAYSDKDATQDIAVLQLASKDQVPSDTEPIRMFFHTELNQMKDHEYEGFGFPEGHEYGLIARGEIRGQLGRTSRVQLAGSSSIDPKIAPGFSGGPVFDKELKGVIGIFKSAIRDETVHGSFAIPTLDIHAQLEARDIKLEIEYPSTIYIEKLIKLFDVLKNNAIATHRIVIGAQKVGAQQFSEGSPAEMAEDFWEWYENEDEDLMSEFVKQLNGLPGLAVELKAKFKDFQTRVEQNLPIDEAKVEVEPNRGAFKTLKPLIVDKDQSAEAVKQPETKEPEETVVDSPDLSFKVENVLRATQLVGIEKADGGFLNHSFISELIRLGRSVVHIRMSGHASLSRTNPRRMQRTWDKLTREDSLGTYVGTGWILGSKRKLLVTANHVLPLADAASTAKIYFNYVKEFATGRKSTQLISKLAPDALFVSSPPLKFQGLDYSVVALEEAAPEEFGFLDYQEGSSATTSERVFAVHHPRGRTKAYVFQNNYAVNYSDHYFTYPHFTQGGSGGCPLFNEKLQLIGLHHVGNYSTELEGVRLLTGLGSRMEIIIEDIASQITVLGWSETVIADWFGDGSVLRAFQNL